MAFSLANDYSEGAHPQILHTISAINSEQFPGYGTDRRCAQAADKIRSIARAPEAAVFFLTGGTQTNRTVISALLRPHEGVISAATGHIAVHEAGAIENSGHKVLSIPATEEAAGKLSASALRTYLEDFYADANHEHMVAPGMVYISHPTEYGMLYSLSELEELHEAAREFSLPLYCDGARLAYGLAAADTDVQLADIARLCDVFYIGGTKCGALFGEAVVFSGMPAPAHFITHIKLNGALLAKGWLLGAQFAELFSQSAPDAIGHMPHDGTLSSELSNSTRENAPSSSPCVIGSTLYGQLGHHANELAGMIRAALRTHGYHERYPNSTNQVFFELSDEQFARLSRHVTLSFWERISADHVLVRACTSWATPSERVAQFCDLLARFAPNR
ncbi:MAG: aminotransferase class I/II-fold pyridoxal phosphate-dependent enzyme [Arcanobacterium sp.]|nr:aminotransferase class I/II-fold pyridoxal phosphate-dependent enzyme [Arcanobacterium sp.]MDY5588566.1 aminotransferase class I/II-fold pyridoxal phosphate-dependent enzyme [Arcanobacterium sp.]